VLFNDYDSKDDANTTDIIVIRESINMLFMSLEWRMKWKPDPKKVFQAFDPLVLLHPLSESRETVSPQGCLGAKASLTHSPPLSEGHQSQPL